MNKILVIFLASGLTSATYAAYLDDWSNDDLCGWMASSPTPEYIQTEVKTRKIICYAGSEVTSLPSSKDYSSKGGTVFPSPDPSLIPVISNENDKSYSY